MVKWITENVHNIKQILEEKAKCKLIIDMMENRIYFLSENRFFYFCCVYWKYRN